MDSKSNSDEDKPYVLPRYRYFLALAVISVCLGLSFLITYYSADGKIPSSFEISPELTLFATVFVSFAVNWLVALPAIYYQTEKFFDLTGSITYISCTLFSLILGASRQNDSMKFSPRAIVQSTFVIIWALRLGSFLFQRIKRDSKDGRFDYIKINPPRFFAVWTIQGVWVTLTAMTVFVVNSGGSVDNQKVGPLDIIGWLVWLTGFAIEVVSDSQKTAFNSDPANKGKWIDVGLWYYSRHPNYFGEIILWLGQFIAAASIFEGSQWICVICPLFVIFLLMCVSGVPGLEKRGLEKWGQDKDYLLYVKNTSVLILWFKGSVKESEVSLLVEKKEEAAGVV